VLAVRIAKELEIRNYHTVQTCNFCILLNEDLKKFDVIIPIWSCGIKGGYYLNMLLDAVKSGVGLVTFHGGISWFEEDKYYDMIGGFYLCDTKPETYHINIANSNHPITSGIGHFEVNSEKYFLMTNPGNNVLAYANFSGTNMPVAWIRNYGKGRVFYSSLAHTAEEFFNVSNFTMFLNAIDWVSNTL
jgi:type 1 glutamine amidotransferase